MCERLAPYVAPVVQPRVADIAVSLGVGENTSKRIDDDFEFAVLQKLLELWPDDSA